MWNLGADDAGVSQIAAGYGGGLIAELGDHVGLVLCGEVATNSREFTVRGEGAGQWVGRRDEGASTCHDSKIS
jgi:hypothetical protein